MNNHITDTYTSKQQMLEHVLQDERDKKKVEEPWYIKIGDDEENVPVFKPKGDSVEAKLLIDILEPKMIFYSLLSCRNFWNYLNYII